MRPIGEDDLSYNVTCHGIEDIDVVGRAIFPSWDIEQPSVRLDREPIDAWTDRSIPGDRVVVYVKAINPASLRGTEIRDVEPPGDNARRHASDIADVRNRRNGFEQAMPSIDLVDRD